MDLSRQSDTQEEQGPDCDAKLQNKEPGLVIQTDLGRQTLAYPNLDPQFQSFKITQGIKISIQGPKKPGGKGVPGFYRHGFPLEVKEWLDAVVGTTCGNHLWEFQGQGEWLHTGTRGSNREHERLGFNANRPILDFYFRDRHKAALFVVRWHGHL